MDLTPSPWAPAGGEQVPVWQFHLISGEYPHSLGPGDLVDPATLFDETLGTTVGIRVSSWENTVRLLCVLLLLLAGFASTAVAFDPPKPQEVRLWDDGPPGVLPGATPGSDDGTGRYWNVGIPSLWVYSPESPPPEGGRIALIVCCGGGYSHLTRLVGADGAVEAFLPKGVVLVALRYRTTPPSESVETDALADGQRAIRLVRANAEKWGIHPHKIGVFGWSAGAHLTLNVASHFDEGNANAPDPIDRVSSRPDFVAMLSPWPSRPARPISDYPIGPDAPPAFIASAEDDTTAPVTFARSIATAYQKAGVEHQLFVTESGGHGAFTIGAPGEGGKWIERFWPWLERVAAQSAVHEPGTTDR
jgi:acetyl esterase/lipase